MPSGNPLSLTNTGQDGFTDPVQQWDPGDASPSGITHLGGTLFIANLRGQVLRAVPGLG